MTQRGQHDCRPVSIISLSAIAKLSEALDMSIDKRRFRANFYVEWDNQVDPNFEFSLVGKRLKIGDRLELAILERDARCKMITLDPETAEATPRLLRYLAKNHGGDAGVFAAVLRDGRVNKGDPIVVI
jgi:hypothetical protein